ENDKTVWCGNLHKLVSEEIIYELMLQAGPIDTVKLITNKDPSNSNYAFIKFQHRISVAFAKMLFNGLSLYNNPIKVQSRYNSKTRSSNLS
ncbi:hypothetical protein HELRODRAFT_136690, partial [Helobdella robusta]|uniref:RRM domain-containing protein n=1 Tax=Helobdella robusta TaxID=6412 RepID=T1EIF2_HELRO